MISAAAPTPFHHHFPLVSIRQFKRNFPTRTTKAVMILKIFFHLSFLQKNLLLVTHLTVCRCEPCHLVMIVFVLPPYITFGKVSANITGKHDIAVSYYDKQVIRQFFPNSVNLLKMFFSTLLSKLNKADGDDVKHWVGGGLEYPLGICLVYTYVHTI